MFNLKQLYEYFSVAQFRSGIFNTYGNKYSNITSNGIRERRLRLYKSNTTAYKNNRKYKTSLMLNELPIEIKLTIITIIDNNKSFKLEIKKICT